MATVENLSNLFQKIAAENWTAAKLIAAEIAENEDQRGHHSAARLLRGALHPNGHRVVDPRASAPGLAHADFLAGALALVPADIALAAVALRRPARHELERLMLEWRHRHELLTHGVDRRRKLLFHGPPGCGKSLTARAFGRELSLPVFVVRLDAVVGAYLGQTALRIRELFRFAESTDCVLLLDEVDALAKRRGNPLDVGELDRVVIALLQELEHATPRGFVVATSNLPEHLDDALFRRFDTVVAFPKPTNAELRRFAKQRLAAGSVVLSGAATKRLAAASTYAEVDAAIAAAARDEVLDRIVR